MKTSPLWLIALAFAGIAAAATPKKPPAYNQSRVGPYAVGSVGTTSYTGDQEATEDFLLDLLTQGSPAQNLEVSTDDSGIGYQAQFGYRFHRYIAAEIGLVQFGDLKTDASGDVDYDSVGVFESATAKFKYNASGVLMSAVGVLPLGEKVELLGRVGYMFANAERDVSIAVEGETVGSGRFNDDTGEVVYGVGVAFYINQAYALRLDYQLADKVGSSSVGEEDLNFLALGLQVRF
jgi:hypothetical protein